MFPLREQLISHSVFTTKWITFPFRIRVYSDTNQCGLGEGGAGVLLWISTHSEWLTQWLRRLKNPNSFKRAARIKLPRWKKDGVSRHKSDVKVTSSANELEHEATIFGCSAHSGLVQLEPQHVKPSPDWCIMQRMIREKKCGWWDSTNREQLVKAICLSWRCKKYINK